MPGSASPKGEAWGAEGNARRLGRDARARERVPLGRLHMARYDSPPAHSLCRASRPILLHTRSPAQDMPGSASPKGEAWGAEGNARRLGRDARARERVPLGRLHMARYDSPPAHSLCRASRPILLHTRSPAQDMPGSASPKGEARRKCAAKPRRSAGARRHAAHSRESDVELRGGGGRVDLTKTSRRQSRSADADADADVGAGAGRWTQTQTQTLTLALALGAGRWALDAGAGADAEPSRPPLAQVRAPDVAGQLADL